MKAADIKAFIAPTTDPHAGEYTPEYWKTREWLSGFTGSAGTVVITADKAGLWTDSRYFLQAEKQLEGSGITLFRAGLPETPTLTEWLCSELAEGDCAGIEGEVFTASEAKSLIRSLTKKGLKVNTDFAPHKQIWNDRPPLPANPCFILPEQISGKSCREKIEEILNLMEKEEADVTILAALDSIAWLFNLRGSDIEYNPVCLSYAAISKEETVLFINPAKLTEEVAKELVNQGVRLADYEKITTYASRLPKGKKVLLDLNKINYLLYSLIPAECKICEVAVHPADSLKGVKNETEIEGVRRAMIKDGAALVKFGMWLENALANGEKISELSVEEKLHEFRGEQEDFVGESFATIAGYGPHGAIVHYEADSESDAEIRPEGLLLLDSGGQYLHGTTDITRTYALGKISGEIRKDYTCVLKGHIDLASARFPKGTVGMQLDVLARQHLWRENANYLHGTGHGVGHFLNVHEGPQSIRMNYNPAKLEPGMITSNEPGIYRAGKYGVRIENLLLTVESGESEFGGFYAFETLTLCPIDKKPIDKSLMTKDEINWLNNYHKTVYEKLSPVLNEEEKRWLKTKTEEI
jgi:Xaa-Pro aminopeptidase